MIIRTPDKVFWKVTINSIFKTTKHEDIAIIAILQMKSGFQEYGEDFQIHRTNKWQTQD